MCRHNRLLVLLGFLCLYLLRDCAVAGAQQQVSATVSQICGGSFSSPPYTSYSRLFSYTIPLGFQVIDATLSGSWGNSCYSQGTAGVDIKLAGVLVAQCVKPNSGCWADHAGPPRTWTKTVPSSLYVQLGSGSMSLTVQQTSEQFVELGSMTLKMTIAPAPTLLVAAGGYHSCAVRTGGGIKCWGWNAYGQLGDGSTTSRPAPTPVNGLANGLAAGYGNSCAVTAGGELTCWGKNGSGEVGDGTTTNRWTPTPVTGLAGSISVGLVHTCEVTNLGGVSCWGWNFCGQLGDGTTTDHTTPMAVTGLTGVAAVAAGDAHSCARTTAGGVACWGYNLYGQLGDGTTTDRHWATTIIGMGGMAQVTAGGFHTCALSTARDVRCWGYNGSGQLGDGTTTNRSLPTQVTWLLNDVTQVSAGGHHTCALTTAGAVKCWGANSYGQLGDGTTTDRKSAVAPVSGLDSGVEAVSAGRYHTCALLTGGDVKCWGFNGLGQLGDGTTTDRLTPVLVNQLQTGYTDDPLAAGMLVKAVHFAELRQQIDELRARYGLDAYAWTDTTLAPGVTMVKASHLTELRAALAEVYVAAGRAVPGYGTPSIVAQSTVITASHIAELRSAILAIW